MEVTITPSAVTGSTAAPPSKSYTHRAILASGYDGTTTISNALWSADTRATARAVERFGGSVRRSKSSDTVEVDGFEGRPSVPESVIDCANSGTTMRLVTATAALADGTTVLTGDASLRSRPQGPLLNAISDLGGQAFSTRSNGQAPLVVTGPISGGAVSIPGDISSQFISALLMAGAVTDEGIDLELETSLKSAPYVDITIEVLEAFDVEVRKSSNGYFVPGSQVYDSRKNGYMVPGDFSSISYLVSAGVIAGDDDVQVTGAVPSAQGDTAIVDIIERMNGDIAWDTDNGVINASSSTLDGITVSVEDTPDLLPTIAVLGAVADGKTEIIDAAHVRLKETDRVSAMAEELGKMGVHTEEDPDSLTIYGENSTLKGAHVDGRGDHRIVMALSIAALVAEGKTVISDAEHVDVSFPEFFEQLASLGVTIDD